MIKLFNEQQFINAKCKDKLPLQCLFCKNTFYTSRDNIVRAEMRKQETCEYCSLECYGKQNTLLNTKKVNCKNCNKEFTKLNSQIKKHPNHFCGNSCAAKYNNARKTKGTRISKLEVWLQNELTTLYPNLEFHFNKTSAINAELDIYIPSLKIAFELNGIFHYEPIYGADKFSKIVDNDKRKFAACIEKGIGLCIIDHSHEIRFKVEKSKKYLKIITDIIDQAVL